MPNRLEERQVHTHGLSATLCLTFSTLSSVRIFRWPPLQGRSATELSSSKRPNKLLIMKAVGADLELKCCRYLCCVMIIDC
ncbi:hypothetical protein TNCV_1261041 [Trichonephila clavipes]|nr:hypothetical protein TNCV_1261041 [Trichonephila clavipes]